MSNRLAYVILAFGMFFTLLVLTREINKEQINRDKKQTHLYLVDQTKRARAGCERNNNRARESNARIFAHKKQNKAIRLIGTGAEKARLQAYDRDHQQFDLDAARVYESAVKLVDSIEFKKLPLVNCAKAYPFP